MSRSVTVNQYLTGAPVPFQVVMAPGAATKLERTLRSRDAPTGMIARAFSPEQSKADGPAILLLTPEDLLGPNREALTRLAQTALPGRPILVGGGGSRDILLYAINSWRVFRVVPEETLPSGLFDALRKTYEAMQMECGLERAAGELREETARLEEALASLERSQKDLVQAERLATLGRVTTGLIPIISGYLEDLEEFRSRVGTRVGTNDPGLGELLGFAFSGVRTLSAMLDELRGFAQFRPESNRWELEDLDPMVEFAVNFGRFNPLSEGRHLRTQLRSGAKVRGDCYRLYQVFINLLRNAFQATATGGRIEVRTFVDGKDAVVEVANEGPPIAAEIQARLFEPFFTTKGSEGMGLGLSMCRITIERHGGTITCESAADRETCFRIRLPAAT